MLESSGENYWRSWPCAVARDDKAFIDTLLRQKPMSAYSAHWACQSMKRAGSAVLVRKSIPVLSGRGLHSSISLLNLNHFRH
jgi:hypothetical protein